MPSQLYNGLAGKNFAQVLFGRFGGLMLPAAARLGSAALAAKTAGLLGNPALEEVVAPMMGNEAAGEQLHAAMSGPRDNVINLVNAARENPAVSCDLQMKATAANLRMAPNLRSLLTSLGVSEAAALPGAPGEDPGEEGR